MNDTRFPDAQTGAAQPLPTVADVFLPLPAFGTVTDAMRRWILTLNSRPIYVPIELRPVLTKKLANVAEGGLC
jgi:hypothetical protein